MSARQIQLGLIALVTCAAGCTSWSRLANSQPVPTRGTVQVWTAGQNILLRDPTPRGDSLVGRGPLPDTTRRAIALTTIDSLRVQTTDAGKVVIVGTGVAIALLLVSAASFQGMEE
jgi:hypothetical protein